MPSSAKRSFTSKGRGMAPPARGAQRHTHRQKATTGRRPITEVVPQRCSRTSQSASRSNCAGSSIVRQPWAALDDVMHFRSPCRRSRGALGPDVPCAVPSFAHPGRGTRVRRDGRELTPLSIPPSSVTKPCDLFFRGKDSDIRLRSAPTHS